MAQDKYNVLLDEMLELAEIPLNEAEDDEEAGDDEVGMPKISPSDIEKALGKEDDEDDKEKDDDEKSDEPEEELEDQWEKDFRTGSKFRIEFHENYVYVWYRNKRSSKIQIPDLLRKNKKLVSELFEKLLSHVEKVS